MLKTAALPSYLAKLSWVLPGALAFAINCGPPEATDAAVASSEQSLGSADLAGYVETPFGLYHASCVHEVADGAEVDYDGSVRHADGTSYRLPECEKTHYSTRAKSPPPTTNGWVVDANFTSSSWIRKLVANFDVPTTPSHNSSQTIYFFPGIEPTAGTEILQPVLAYRGATNAWTMESWYCGPSCVHSTMVTVKPGDNLLGTVLGSSCTTAGTCATWTITTQDVTTNKTTTVTRTSDPYVFKWAFGGVLEAYAVSSCTDYPASGTIHFSNIAFFDQNLKKLTSSFTSSVPGKSPACSFKSTNTASTVTLTY